MKTLHEKYPQYNWKQNKGYPTVAHRRAITAHGITPFHRLSFNLNEQIKMEFWVSFHYSPWTDARPEQTHGRASHSDHQSLFTTHY